MNNYAVRVATLADAAGVSAVLAASYPTLMESAYDKAVLDRALELITKAQPALLESGRFYIAESQDELVVGCGGWSIERPGDGLVEAKRAYIRHFVTHPEWTNRGIGRAIYGQCESDARSAGITSFDCYSSLNAEGFYCALGFVRTRRIDLEIAPKVNLPSVLMRLQF